MQTSQVIELAKERVSSALQTVRPHFSRPGEYEAMERLTRFLCESEAPASSSASHHGAFPGGLLVHSFRVYEVLCNLASNIANGPGGLGLLGGLSEETCRARDIMVSEIISLNPGSLFKVAILHDFNKLQDLLGRPVYIPNVLKSGQISAAKPWEKNKKAGAFACLGESMQCNGPAAAMPSWWNVLLGAEGISVRDGVISLAVAESIVPGFNQFVSQQEANAIIYHDGAYAGRTGLQGNECLLQILLHAADMVAARLIC